MPAADDCFWPIIYVRGYAMTRGEIDETTADPFNGFNLGSTVMRARPDKAEPPKKFVFESPVVRLLSDFGYGDVYQDGVDIVDPDWKGGIPLKSIIIHRYYDDASSFLGKGKTPEIEDFAKRLSELILAVQARVCELEENAMTPPSALIAAAPEELHLRGGDAPFDALVLAGVPLNESVARYGPFVMNTEAEIHQAIRDYQSGNFGDIRR